MNPTCSWFGQDGPHSNRLTLTNCLFTRARKLPSSSTSPVTQLVGDIPLERQDAEVESRFIALGACFGERDDLSAC